jgi:hypothetical protein
MKNILGIEVTKPDNKLIVMRGVSGAGKSTNARELVFDNNGVIYSTDTTIEKEFGDYNKFFQDMVEKNDFSNLHKAHQKTLRNAKIAIDSNVPYIIVDNTNIKAWEPKEYVLYALENGYSDDNIIIVDVGNGGLTPEELFERNLHGVPLDKIQSMYDSHAAHSPMTLEKIINSKNPFDKKILYSAIVLTEESKFRILNNFTIETLIPKDWSIFNHHQTIIFGKELPEDMKEDLGKEITLTVTHFGITDKVIAIKTIGYENLDGKVPHITIAVNTKENGSPKMSGDIIDWIKIDTMFNVKGIVTEVMRDK